MVRQRPAPKPATPKERPARVTKTAAKALLTKVTKAAARRPTRASAPPADLPEEPPASPLPPIDGFEDRLLALENGQLNNRLQLETLETTLTRANTELMRSMNDSFGLLTARLDNPVLPAGNPDIPIPPGNIPPVDVLSRWPWVDKATIQSIANGVFEISDLAKLHRQEPFRNAHASKRPEGFVFPSAGGEAVLITASSRMQISFSNQSIFFSAWTIYMSIRTSYQPERAAGLLFWSERLLYHSQCYPWNICLLYAIEYFTAHQNQPCSVWYSLDADLLTAHFMTVRLPALPTPAAHAPPPSRSPKKTPTSIPIHLQVCMNWNRSNGGCKAIEQTGEKCPRRHICLGCGGDHIQPRCPQRASTSN
jgi:hypothetical protein